MPLIAENRSSLIDRAVSTDTVPRYITQDEFLRELDQKRQPQAEVKSSAGRSFVDGLKDILKGR